MGAKDGALRERPARSSCVLQHCRRWHSTALMPVGLRPSQGRRRGCSCAMLDWTFVHAAVKCQLSSNQTARLRRWQPRIDLIHGAHVKLHGHFWREQWFLPAHSITACWSQRGRVDSGRPSALCHGQCCVILASEERRLCCGPHSRFTLWEPSGGVCLRKRGSPWWWHPW